jgi:short subunit dehydrogenase-like uncharacterized protein
VAIPDDPTITKRAFVKMKYKGNIYLFTGIVIADVALSILNDVTVAKKMGGGILTPATLGLPLISRLQKSGIEFETRIIGM